MADETAAALISLAVEFSEAGAPVQAVKCLEALVQPGHTSLLPLTEVHARLRLAQLLLEFTDNVPAAKIHLERAVRPSRLRAPPSPASDSRPRSKCSSRLSPPATT